MRGEADPRSSLANRGTEAAAWPNFRAAALCATDTRGAAQPIEKARTAVQTMAVTVA